MDMKARHWGRNNGESFQKRFFEEVALYTKCIGSVQCTYAIAFVKVCVRGGCCAYILLV